MGAGYDEARFFFLSLGSPVATAILKLLILQVPSPKCWYYRHAPLALVYFHCKERFAVKKRELSMEEKGWRPGGDRNRGGMTVGEFPSSRKDEEAFGES